jgi:hypothetical protein
VKIKSFFVNWAFLGVHNRCFSQLGHSMKDVEVGASCNPLPFLDAFFLVVVFFTCGFLGVGFGQLQLHQCDLD